MAALTTVMCPECNKIFICTIEIRNTIAGGRPTLMFPGENCNECDFDFKTLKVESFDIPIPKNLQDQINKKSDLIIAGR
jgi:hypothetical protein